MTGSAELVAARHSAVRQGILLSYATIGYNSLEAIGSLIAGLLSGSVALVGFGIDSVIEVIASLDGRPFDRTDTYRILAHSADRQTYRYVPTGFVYNSRRVGEKFAMPDCDLTS